MSVNFALALTRALIAFAVVLQTIELLQVRLAFSDDGVWSWPLLRKELRYLGGLLSYRAFEGLLFLRLLASFALVFSPYPESMAILLCLTTALICFRFRGTYNGGSDYMTLLILLALSWGGPLALGYIGIQSVLSYFVAGVAKLGSRQWRSGRALGLLLNSEVYRIPRAARDFASPSHEALCKVATWATLAFECGFPLALLNRSWCGFWLLAGIAFHLINFAVLGLNRFFWAWVASYPAIIYLASRSGS